MIKKPIIAIAISAGLFVSSAVYAGSTPPATDPSAGNTPDPSTTQAPTDPNNPSNSLKSSSDQLKANKAASGTNQQGGAGSTTNTTPTPAPTNTQTNQ